ncbi:unnamed protein product [Acanthosepion pharaonis]|uniref:Uncharacterized protein n=1 Tax=Acanthosepion pharaonis TaxID=158019 RepID=A0A812DX80_ACAPH|nr:unnamed protein product [Sepia pharaonis]
MLFLISTSYRFRKRFLFFLLFLPHFFIFLFFIILIHFVLSFCLSSISSPFFLILFFFHSSFFQFSIFPHIFSFFFEWLVGDVFLPIIPSSTLSIFFHFTPYLILFCYSLFISCCSNFSPLFIPPLSLLSLTNSYIYASVHFQPSPLSVPDSTTTTLGPLTVFIYKTPSSSIIGHFLLPLLLFFPFSFSLLSYLCLSNFL